MNAGSWIILVFMVGFDLTLALIRASLVNARLTHLINLGEKWPEKVKKTLELLQRPRLRASLRLMMVFSHLLVASVGWFVLSHWITFPSVWTLMGIFVCIGVAILLLEFGIERIIFRNPEEWAIRMTGCGQVVDALFGWFASLLTSLQGSRQYLEHQPGSVTEDELRTWVEVGQPNGGLLEKEERKMIYSIFQFGDTLCREVMVPRIDVLALDVTTPLVDAVHALIESGHSRVPVYEESIDNVVGLLYAKDLLKVSFDKSGQITLRDLLRPAYFVPESKKVDELLSEIQERGVHIAVVVDEYGGMAGLVTLEDIVEEIVGDIRDEYDQGEEMSFQEINPNEFIFSGRIDLDDFNEITGTHLDKDQTDTLGGFIYSQLGRVPLEGEQVPLEHWTLIVEQVTGRRIGQIRAIKGSHPEMEEISDEPKH